jgi:hypothetical protein
VPCRSENQSTSCRDYRRTNRSSLARDNTLHWTARTRNMRRSIDEAAAVIQRNAETAITVDYAASWPSRKDRW